MSSVRAAPSIMAPLRNSGLRLQRQCACGQHTSGGATCTSCSQNKTMAPPIVHNVLSSTGETLDRSTRFDMEQRFGRDFSQVRVHSDENAAQSAQAVNALAYTVGRHIVFGAGSPHHASRQGRSLLAHELTHVVQQALTHEPTAGPIAVAHGEEIAEREADGNATRIDGGGHATVSNLTGPRLARQPATPAANTAQQPQAAPEPPQRPERQTLVGLQRNNGMGIYNADLDRKGAAQKQPCRMTLEIMINFIPSGPWPAGRFANWIKQFIAVVTKRWSLRFVLAPNGACAAEPCQSAIALLNIIPVSSSASNVIQMTVNYQNPKNARSNAGYGSAQLYGPDVTAPGDDLRRNQTVATHEAGHLLGLEHIHCNTNADECYGTSREEGADVMGRGEIVSERDYAPFAEAISTLTGCAWKVVGHGGGNLFPSSLVAPLAILGGVAGAIAGGALGASLGLGAALGLGALFGALGAGVGALAGLAINEVD